MSATGKSESVESASVKPNWLRTVVGIGSISAARFAAPLLRMAVPIWISRSLGVEGLGNFQLVLSYYALYAAIASAGMWGFVVREMAARPAETGRLLLHVYVLALIATIPTSVIMAGTGVAYDGSVRAGLFIMTFALLPAGVSLYAEGALVAFGRSGTMAAFMVAEEACLTLASCGVLAMGGTLSAVMTVTVIVRCVATVGRLAAVRRLTGPLWGTVDRTLLREMVRQAPVFFGATVLATAFWRLDLVMLSWLGTPTDVGLYAAALRFVMMCQEVPAAAMVLLFPRLSALHAGSAAAFRTLFRSAFRYLTVLAVTTSVVVTLVGPEVIRLVFGPRFDAAGPVLRLLVWSLLPFALMKLLGSALIASHRQNADLVINGAVLVVNVVLKLVMIPLWGLTGAAAATVLAMGAAVALRLTMLREALR
ncbi:MAG: polysaccharide biosynthesis C-terminal domain-containing protein [Candidatus Binatia bacterium]